MCLQPQPMHLDIIRSLAGVIKEICQFCEFCANKKYGGNGMMVDPFAHAKLGSHSGKNITKVTAISNGSGKGGRSNR